MQNLGLCLVIGICLLACTSMPVEEGTPGAISSPAPADPTAQPAKPQPSPPPSSPRAEEVGSRAFWVDPQSEAAQSALRLLPSRPREAAWLRKLATQATAVWFTVATRDPFAAAQRLGKAAQSTQTYAIGVIAALAKRDCGHYQGPGLAPAAYQTWIQQLAQGIGQSPIYWIVEPDALLLTGCLSLAEKDARFRIIAETVQLLKKNPKAQVYIEAGYPGGLSLDEAEEALRKAGVAAADGFALNTGHYEWTEDCIRYGQDLAARLDKTFVIDSARNGKGPITREPWCNPADRAIGQAPQAPTGIKSLDAYLWLKKPGESDGTCNGGPAAGQWWEAKAIELMRNSEYPD